MTDVGDTLSGAGSGAASGFMVGGPWGALAGGALGALGGLFGSSGDNQINAARRLQGELFKGSRGLQQRYGLLARSDIQRGLRSSDEGFGLALGAADQGYSSAKADAYKALLGGLSGNKQMGASRGTYGTSARGAGARAINQDHQARLSSLNAALAGLKGGLYTGRGAARANASNNLANLDMSQAQALTNINTGYANTLAGQPVGQSSGLSGLFSGFAAGGGGDWLASLFQNQGPSAQQQFAASNAGISALKAAAGLYG